MRKIKFISILLVLSMLLTVPAFAFSTGFTDVSEKATYAEAVSYLADAQGVFTGRKPVKTVERRVIERDSGCREYSPIEFTAADKAVFVPNRSRV